MLWRMPAAGPAATIHLTGVRRRDSQRAMRCASVLHSDAESSRMETAGPVASGEAGTMAGVAGTVAGLGGWVRVIPAGRISVPMTVTLHNIHYAHKGRRLPQETDETGGGFEGRVSSAVSAPVSPACPRSPCRRPRRRAAAVHSAAVLHRAAIGNALGLACASRTMSRRPLGSRALASLAGRSFSRPAGSAR